MHIAFTGTQKGMSREQMVFVARLLGRLIHDVAARDILHCHHGCCVGADAEFHEILLRLRKVMPLTDGLIVIHAHPPSDKKKMARIEGADVWYEAKPYLERNRDMVNAAELLIAMPKGPETLRSGTWATIRYAVKTKKRYVIHITKGLNNALPTLSRL